MLDNLEAQITEGFIIVQFFRCYTRVVACKMSTENEDPLQNLNQSIVEIISDNEEGHSTTLGTGFVITDDGLIVTCKHVITDSNDNLVNSVKARFHSVGKTDVKYTAKPVREDQNFKDDPAIDIAFLKLEKLPEKGVTPVKLDDKVVSLNHFASIGFKKAEEFTRLGAEGKIRIPTRIRISKDVLSPEMIQLHSPDNDIEPGMSGAPVLDIERDKVVGIITERYIEQYNRVPGNMAFAHPVKAMLDLCPDLREQNPGLAKFDIFLEKIGLRNSRVYQEINTLYVPPVGFSEIERALRGDRLTIITGPAEYGKTYTALQLLWKFFKNNSKLEPIYIQEQDEKKVDDLLNQLQQVDEMLNHKIIYF